MRRPQHPLQRIADLARLAAAPAAAAACRSFPPQRHFRLLRAADPDAGLHIVKSPIVGTYYGSPSPGAAPFVSPGDRVEKGQVICIVEAMKLMNEIESDASGEIVKCFVTNGQPIEFGQPLFSIREGMSKPVALAVLSTTLLSADSPLTPLTC